MDSLIIAIVVVIAVLGHVALYRWVKFKIQEGQILQYLRDTASGGTTPYHAEDVIASHTDLRRERVNHICSRSKEISANPDTAGSWKAD